MYAKNSIRISPKLPATRLIENKLDAYHQQLRTRLKTIEMRWPDYNDVSEARDSATVAPYVWHRRKAKFRLAMNDD